MRDEKIVNEYKIQEWDSLSALENMLTSMTNAGWQVDNHFGANNKGWTIFRKSVWINPPLLQRKIDLSSVYKILNNLLIPGSDTARDFDRQLKDAVRVEGDTF